MAETIRGTCKGFKDNGLRCGGNPKRGERYCYWCKRKPERQTHPDERVEPKPGQVVNIAEAKRAREGGRMSIEDYERFLEDILTGEEQETRQTSSGDTYDAEARVADKLAAGRELRQLRGWHGDESQAAAADRLGFSIADLLRDKLGV